MLNVGPFQGAKVMASGGIAPDQVAAWLEAGAMAVGIGTQVQSPIT
jgi:2-keto-3-deoxy-6-phosphogluconate aldolase